MTDDAAHTRGRANPPAEALAPPRRGDGTSGTATDPDFGYIAQRRRQRVERILAGVDDGLRAATTDGVCAACGRSVDDDEIRQLSRAVRAYIDVARCLEAPAREDVPDGTYGGARPQRPEDTDA